MDIVYKDFNILSEDQVINLYEDLGWTNYTKNIKKLLFGIQNSSFVYSAWDGKTLVGLVRVISDDYTICYIQDLLVMKAYQRKGIGRHLINKVIASYGHVRQMLVTTDLHNQVAKAFYEHLGFKMNETYDCITLLRIKQD